MSANFFHAAPGLVPRVLAGPSLASPTELSSSLLASSLGQRALSGTGEERQRLESIWGASALQELASLGRETDRPLYFESLHHLARSLRDQDHLEAAQATLAFLAESGSADSALAGRARADLDAILGRGAFGARFEFLARRFAREAANPSMLVGMTAASAVFQVARLGILARLTASPTANFLTRGLGARTLASLGAFALEAPTFALAGRGVRSVLEGGSNPSSLTQEILGSYLTLGGLKLFGALGESAARWSGNRGLTRVLLPQVSTYFGIVAGHRLEQWAGLRPSLSNDTLWSDSLLTLLQFHVGGRLAQELGGSGLHRWQQEFEFRVRETEALSRPEDAGRGWNLSFAEALQPAVAGVLEEPTFSPNVMMMVMKGEGGPRQPAATPRGERVAVSERERNAYEVVQDLVALRARRREEGEEALSLWQLLHREIEAGRVPEARRSELERATYSRTLFENSRLLRTRVSDRTLANIPTAVGRLNSLREDIAREQRLESYSLATLVQALAFGGRIPFEKMRQYVSAAASLDFSQQNPILREIPTKFLADPYLLARHLRPIRRRMEEETGQNYKLATLVEALQWHPDFPSGQLQKYKMVASAGDYVGALSTKRLRLDGEDLRELSFEQVLLRILHLRPALIGAEGEPMGIGYILMGLRSHGTRYLKDGEINETAITQAYALDFAHERWDRWGGHFRNLAELPRRGDGAGAYLGWTRPTYARRFLTRENGESYSTSYLSGLVRWGEFLWEHRKALNLPEPGRIEVPPLDSTRRSRLFAFLASHWDSLTKHRDAPEALFQRLLELRDEFRRNGDAVPEVSGEPREGPSLRIMVASVFQSRGKPIPRTLEVYAAMVDKVLQHWPEWRRHFRRLSELPRHRTAGQSRLDYAVAHLRQGNGETYSTTNLSGLIRWGTWVWNNRGSLGLRDGSSTQPPPGSEAAAEEE